MALTKITVIRPAQTDNSKTAANGAFNKNNNAVRIILVTARPIADVNKLLVKTAHKAAAIKEIRRIKIRVTSTPYLKINY
jgi:archaellum biogenesis ATPase FlaH